jgi:hypothetical protein
MRHKSRTMFAALVAVLALTAVASASASAALPEFMPSAGGKYPITFEGSSATAHSKITNVLEEPPSKCEGFNTRGEITGSKALSLTVEFTKCRDASKECQTVGQLLGIEILSGTAKLVYINKATKQVGIVLAENPAVIKCGSIEYGLRGSLVIPITPLNTNTSKLGLRIEGNGSGTQEFESYENEKGEVVKKAHLELNFGSGYKGMALEVAEELKLATSKPLTVEG